MYIYMHYVYMIYIYVIYIYCWTEKFYKMNVASNSFRMIMMKFNLCDVAAMALVKLDIKKQRWSLFIKY